MLEKKKRVIDKDLLEYIRRSCPCVACGKRPDEGVDPHHLTSRGARGDDTATNILPLCRRHHIEYHQYGPGKMIDLYPSVKIWLELAGREDVLLRAERLESR